jgi:hypothetical protein
MSIISAGTTTTTALINTGDTTGNLILQTNGTTTALTLNTAQALGVGSTPSYGTSGQVLTSAGSAGAPSWTSSLSNFTLTTPVLTGTKETKVAMAANAVDLATGNCFSKTISGATTLTVSNVPAAGSIISFILDLTNGGSAVITWWTGVKWASGTAPTLTSAGRDLLGFFTHDGGTTWNGLVLAKDVK